MPRPEPGRGDLPGAQPLQDERASAGRLRLAPGRLHDGAHQRAGRRRLALADLNPLPAEEREVSKAVNSRSASRADNRQTRSRDHAHLVVGAQDPVAAAEFSFRDLAAARRRGYGQQHGIPGMRQITSRRPPAALDVAQKLRFRGLADEAAADEGTGTVLVDADAQPRWPREEGRTASRGVQKRRAVPALRLDDVLPLRITAGREFRSRRDLDGSPDGDRHPGQMLQIGCRRRERLGALPGRQGRPDYPAMAINKDERWICVEDRQARGVPGCPDRRAPQRCDERAEAAIGPAPSGST